MCYKNNNICCNDSHCFHCDLFQTCNCLCSQNDVCTHHKKSWAFIHYMWHCFDHPIFAVVKVQGPACVDLRYDALVSAETIWCTPHATMKVDLVSGYFKSVTSDRLTPKNHTVPWNLANSSNNYFAASMRDQRCLLAPFVKNWRIFVDLSLTARMPLMMATSMLLEW